MAHRHQGLSRTLPKNFTFPSLAAREPRTPDRALTDLDVPPPPPRHSSCRLRRSRVRSGTDLFAQAEYDRTTFNPGLSDVPLPSIEFPAHNDPTPEPRPAMPVNNDRLLAPPRDQLDMKTPPAQIGTIPVDSNTDKPWPAWEYQHPGNATERPKSVCSNASDSSVSSIETFASRPSVGGSCTSMESEAHDPFMNLEIPPKQAAERPPSPPKPRKMPTRDRWTLEMDNHLWNTYQLYLQDPTITPFKMTPGSIPPLGVTHRVAREAKKTWGKRRLGAHRHQLPLSRSSRQSRNATPTGKTDSSKPFWPRSETSTRRRLKLLCKRKFSIAPHYQRMMQSRTPTPFETCSRSSRETSQVNTNSGSAPYATRDLGVSLVSAAAPGPLSQFAADEDPRQVPAGDWFRQPVYDAPQSEAEEPVAKSLNMGDPDTVPRLGSPFKFQTWGPGRPARRARVNGTGRRETIHIPEPRRRTPARFNPLPNLYDGRPQDPAYADESSPMAEDTQNHLEELFCEGKLNESGKRRVRIRGRGATTSSVNSRGLDQLFSPPSSLSSSTQHEENAPAKAPNPLLDISGEGSKRLGSPFHLDGLKRPGVPSKLLKHAPSLSDPFVSGILSQSEDEMKSSHPSDSGGRHL
jgi:hypothetical protein